MTGRLKVYDADIADWKYVDSAGEQVELLRYVPLAAGIKGPTIGTNSSTTASTGVLTTPVHTGIPATAVAVNVHMLAAHSVATTGHRFNVFSYGVATYVGQMMSGKLANSYESLTCPYVVLGGDRQFQYEIVIGAAGTTTYWYDIIGYWEVVPTGAIATGGGNVVGKGTAFPGSPAVNDQFYRTDLHIQFFWNGTRWLSDTLYDWIIPGLANLAATDNDNSRIAVPPLRGCSDIWLENFYPTYYVATGTALSASHKWTYTIKRNAGAGGAQLDLATKTIDSGAMQIYRFDGPQAINLLLGSGAASSGFTLSTAVKTGTPGNFYMYASFSYRLVAT